jgi:uncharacterized membrane protein AbrB (regulator of aidB expression)
VTNLSLTQQRLELGVLEFYIVTAARYSELVLSLLAFVAVGLVVGLNLSSYHLQELLVCWLCFSIGFVSLAFAILAVVLAYYTGKYLIQCTSAAVRAIARAAQRSAKPL